MSENQTPDPEPTVRDGEPTAAGDPPPTKLNQLLLDALSQSPDGKLPALEIVGLACNNGFAKHADVLLERAHARGIVRPTPEEVEKERAEQKERELELIRARKIDLRKATAKVATLNKPLFEPFDFAVVRAIEFNIVASAGLEVVQKAPDRPSLGYVVAVGPGFNRALAEHGNPKLEPDTIVLFSKYGGQEILLPEGRFWILAPPEVFGRYNGSLG